jgi:hypothetical protein
MSLSSFEKTNLRSKKVRTFHQLLLILFGVYVCGGGAFVLLRIVGESFPQTWDAIVTWVYGMRFEFSLDKAGPLFGNSIMFLVISLLLVLAFWVLRLQILRVLLLAFALLGLAYLFCAVFLLVIPIWWIHVAMLLLLAILFVFMFISQSNIQIYLRDRTYPDAILESLVALFFLFFIVRMLMMALMGETS